MKKLLLTTAIVGAATFAVAAPAQADIQLGLGGHFKGYLSWVDQDEAAGVDVRDFDMVRDTEIHFTGETTLDNGLTVGFHAEETADGGEFATQESYAYFAGNWGRVNFGAEDGAAYLLQVAAPSADSNFDGIRQYVRGVSYAAAPAAVSGALFGAAGTGLATPGTANVLTVGRVFDYDHSATGYADKITYITPVFSGFQAAASYTPDARTGANPTLQTITGTGAGLSSGYAGSYGNGTDSVAGSFGAAYEGAVRYEGQFNAARITLGAGYSNLELEANTAGVATGLYTDDIQTWNVGANVGFGPFNLGAAYLESNNGDFRSGAAGTSANSDSETWVVGADYTTGPFVLGASYYNQTQERGTLGDLDTDRYTGGVTYTYGPGMSFRGSVSHVSNDLNTAGVADFDATTVLLGTQINF
ncbi:MAG: Porin 41 (Por41) precursor [Micavibrio sp.]|nr:Porin 41 (Por41) precursor [Micavibrio sp.]